jgi:hypothetical protein
MKGIPMGKNFYNGTDAEVLAGSAGFSAKITATPTAYGLVAAQATSYAAVDAIYADAYATANDPVSRTKGNIAVKNAAKASLIGMASDLAKIINGTATVTDGQKLDLGLNVRAQPVPNPPPVFRPTVDLVSVVGRLVKVHIHDSESPSKRGKPALVLGAYVYSYVGATYPTDPSQWQFEGSSTKNTFDVLFPDSVAVGAQVWICATWINRKTETGPLSMPITTNVQGGLSMAG